MRDKRRETGDERGFSEVLSEKFSAYNLPGPLSRTKKCSSLPLNEIFSRLSELASNYAVSSNGKKNRNIYAAIGLVFMKHK